MTRAGDSLSSLQATLQRDERLHLLAQSPLMLNIMSLTYQNADAGELRDATLQTDEARRHHLFDTYIARMFSRRGMGKLFDEEVTKRGLILAGSQYASTIIKMCF